MVNLETKLTGNIEAALSEYEKKIKDSIVFSGAAAMARVVYDEVKLNASPPRMGKVTGNLEDSIYRVYAADRSGEDHKTYLISWNKTKAPHGHLLEFGTSRMPAKPFIRPAADKLPQAIEAGLDRMAERIDDI